MIELEGARVVAALNNVSGHYRPGPESLDVARRSLDARGLRILPAGVEQYDFVNYRIRALLDASKPNWALLDTLIPTRSAESHYVLTRVPARLVASRSR